MKALQTNVENLMTTLKETRNALEKLKETFERDQKDQWTNSAALQSSIDALKKLPHNSIDHEQRVKSLEMDFIKMRSLLVEKSIATGKERPTALGRRMFGGKS